MKITRAPMPRELRLLVAFAAAALVPALVIGCWFPLANVHTISSMVGSAVVLLPFSMIAVLAGGGPLYAVCAKFGFVRWWTAVAAGLIGAGLVSYLTASPHGFRPEALIAYVCAGVGSEIVFWLLLPSAKSSHANAEAHEA